MQPKKLPSHTQPPAQAKLEALRQIAPECFTETRKANGEIRYQVDFEALREALGDTIADAEAERYGFHWVGKQAAKRAAAEPIRRALRPCPELSVDWDTTQNLYIEGDNLEVLKLLQRSYLGKVKMIYIDPPYNTGNDFVYQDAFTRSRTEYDAQAGDLDEEGNRLRKSQDASPRFHSDWCSMIYSRLLVARSLLAEDGVIFISIDDNEVHNLRRICDEVFGQESFRNTLIVRRRVKSLNSQFADRGLASLNVGYEYVMVYSRSAQFLMKAIRKAKEQSSPKGRWDVFWSNADRPTMRYELLGFTPSTGQWRNAKEKAEAAVRNYQTYCDQYASTHTIEEYSSQTGITDFIRRIPGATGKNGGVQHWVPPSDSMLRTSNWLDIEASQIGKEIDIPFDNPKNRLLIQELIQLSEFTPTDLILDFFSGSATTAHAVMQLNAEDGGSRRYICVQLPEETPPDSQARKAGYANICEIGRERIRRAGKRIREAPEHQGKELDTGFRALRVDAPNELPIHTQPAGLTQGSLFEQESLIRPDRTELDLLFGCMLSWGVPLSLPISQETIDGQRLHIVGEGELVACFGDAPERPLIERIAQLKPLRIALLDRCFGRDADKINLFEQLKQLCGWSDGEAYQRIRVM